MEFFQLCVAHPVFAIIAVLVVATGITEIIRAIRGY